MINEIVANTLTKQTRNRQMDHIQKLTFAVLLLFVTCCICDTYATEVHSLDQVPGAIKSKEGRAHFNEQMNGIPLPDGFGTSLPAGLSAKTIVQLIAPGNDASLATLVGMKAWPYQKNTFIAIACFASNMKSYDDAMKYTGGKPVCQADGSLFDYKDGARVPWKIYLAILQFGDSDVIPKVIATYGKPLDVQLDTGHTDLATARAGGYPETYDRFDFAQFKISKNEIAFGIRAHWNEGYAGGGGDFESIMLFSQNAGHIINVLSEPIYYQKDIAGDWHADETRDHFEYEGANIVSILAHSTNGFYDLQLKTKGKNWKQNFAWDEKEKRYKPTYPNQSQCFDKNGVSTLETQHLKPQFIYSLGAIYCINPMTGDPIQIHGPIGDEGIDQASITITPTGTYAYVANQRHGGSILAYHIDATTGDLTPVPGSPFAKGIVPVSVAVNPAGTFAYVANPGDGRSNGSLSAYNINATTGALTPVPGSPFATGNIPVSVTVNPAGTFAYVANENHGSNGSISAYRIDAATGALTPVPGSPFATGILPVSVTVNPAGTFAYVANQGDFSINGSISAYRIDAATGALKPVPGSPFAKEIIPVSVTVNPAGTFAYVANRSNGSISAFRINATTGALKSLPGRTFAKGFTPVSVAINPAGTFVYVEGIDDAEFSTIMVYRINADTGALTQIPGSPFVVTDSGSLTITQPQ